MFFFWILCLIKLPYASRTTTYTLFIVYTFAGLSGISSSISFIIWRFEFMYSWLILHKLSDSKRCFWYQFSYNVFTLPVCSMHHEAVLVQWWAWSPSEWQWRLTRPYAQVNHANDLLCKPNSYPTMNAPVSIWLNRHYSRRLCMFQFVYFILTPK